MKSNGAYLVELLAAEGVLAKRELRTFLVMYSEVFVFLPELDQSIRELLDLENHLVNFDSIVDEIKQVLNIHAQWIAKFRSLPEELKEQPALVGWLEHAKKFATSLAFKSLVNVKDKESPFYGFFESAIREAASQLQSKKDNQQKSENDQLSHKHQIELHQSSSVNTISEKNAKIVALKLNINEHEKMLVGKAEYLKEILAANEAQLKKMREANEAHLTEIRAGKEASLKGIFWSFVIAIFLSIIGVAVFSMIGGAWFLAPCILALVFLVPH